MAKPAANPIVSNLFILGLRLWTPKATAVGGSFHQTRRAAAKPAGGDQTGNSDAICAGNS
jgi:hypothetical protein